MQPETLLQHLATVESVDTLDLVGIFNEDHQKIIGALKSIEANGNLVISEPATRKSLSLTDEGQLVLKNGSHEAAVYNAVPAEGISQAELMKVSYCYCICFPDRSLTQLGFPTFRPLPTPRWASARP